jgi:hypothetical protein
MVRILELRPTAPAAYHTRTSGPSLQNDTKAQRAHTCAIAAQRGRTNNLKFTHLLQVREPRTNYRGTTQAIAVECVVVGADEVISLVCA